MFPSRFVNKVKTSVIVSWINDEYTFHTGKKGKPVHLHSKLKNATKWIKMKKLLAGIFSFITYQ